LGFLSADLEAPFKLMSPWAAIKTESQEIQPDSTDAQMERALECLICLEDWNLLVEGLLIFLVKGYRPSKEVLFSIEVSP